MKSMAPGTNERSNSYSSNFTGFDGSPSPLKDKAAALGAKNAAAAAPKKEAANDEARVIEIETLFVGGGPATISILSNAY